MQLGQNLPTLARKYGGIEIPPFKGLRERGWKMNGKSGLIYRFFFFFFDNSKLLPHFGGLNLDAFLGRCQKLLPDHKA